MTERERVFSSPGYAGVSLTRETKANIDLINEKLPQIIYNQGVLEEMRISEEQIDALIHDPTAEVEGVSAADIQKTLNLYEAWSFVTDPDVLDFPTDLNVMCEIAKRVNCNLLHQPGSPRKTPVHISGTTYQPAIPIESVIRDDYRRIIEESADPADAAMGLCLYSMRAQIFLDGNKRASVVLANHYLVRHGAGLLVVPAEDVPEFRNVMVRFYESNDMTEAKEFMSRLLIPTQ